MRDRDLSGKVFGNYRLIRHLGQGGFATVYEGEHIHLGIRTAVKFLAQQISFNAEDTKNFLQEAQLIASLDHPHIIRLLDYSVQDAQPFLVMEYAPGGTLGNRHANREIVETSAVISYIKQIASALQYAHDRKVIHRDVKPNNMLIKENGEILLSDFGIAIMSNTSDLASQQSIIGTLSFMAPEQILGQPRYASDQYALAICAYLWLCGTYPFQGSSSELLVKHLHMAPPLPRTCNPTLPVQVEQVLLKALAKKPEDRFQSVEMFSQSLEQAYQGHNIIMALPVQEYQKPKLIEKPTLEETSPRIKMPAPMVPNPSAITERDLSLLSPPKTAGWKASSILSGLRFLVRLPIYLLLMPLLILLTPLLLLYYYGIRALHKPNQQNNAIKQPSPLATAVSLLHLPKGFWPIKLLVEAPDLPQQSTAVAISAGNVMSSVTAQVSSKENGSPKRFWQLAVQFILQGPVSLQGEFQDVQSLSGHQHPLHSTRKSADNEFVTYTIKPPRPFTDTIGHQQSLNEESIINTKGRKNFCVLYHPNDRSWAEWIAWLLEEDGLSTIMPDWDFRAGYNIIKETRNAIKNAYRIIVIISPDYLDARNTQWGIVFSREMLTREGEILPIITRDCGTQLRKPLDALVSINLVGRDVLHTSEKLRKAVRFMRSKPTNPPIFPPEALYGQMNTTDRQYSKRGTGVDSNQQNKEMSGLSRRYTPMTNPLATRQFGTSNDEGTTSLTQQTNLIENAFEQKDWPDVIRKSKWIIQHSSPGSVPWKIYRMQALAYHAQGKVVEATEALETALALVSDKGERLALLDEYTNALAALKRWQEMLIYAEEALTLVPDDIRWQALRDHITMHINWEKSNETEESFVIKDHPIGDQSKMETMRITNQHGDPDKKTRVFNEAPFDQRMRGEGKRFLVPSTPFDIFIAYSPDDQDLCIDLKRQLTSLTYKYRLTIKYDHDVSAGKERIKIIEEHIKKAHIIILLLSPSFLGSVYHRWQTNLALERSQESAIRVIPVLLKPSDWEETPLGHLQPLPTEKGAITTWRNRDEAFLNVVQGIRRTIQELQSHSNT